MMPPGGGDARGNQVATLTGLARDAGHRRRPARAMDAAEAALAGRPEDDLDRRALAHARREIGVLARIPAGLVAETAELSVARPRHLGRGARRRTTSPPSRRCSNG